VSAIASLATDERTRASGLALVGSASGFARMLASIAFGAAWSRFGAGQALTIAAGGLIIAIACASRLRFEQRGIEHELQE
jgi:hypothetical protein